MNRNPAALVPAPQPVCRNALCARPEPANPFRDGWRRGYCQRCYRRYRRCWRRWRDAGFPESGLPQPGRPWQFAAAGRHEDYAELRSWGLSLAEAADRMQVTRRTAQRYEAALRDRDAERIAA